MSARSSGKFLGGSVLASWERFLSVVQNPTEREKVRKLEDKLIAQGKMEEKDRYVWPNNKLIALSSASYKFEYLYF